MSHNRAGNVCKKINHPDAYSASMAAVSITKLRNEKMGYWRVYLCSRCGSHHVGRRRYPRSGRLGRDVELLMWGGWRLSIAESRENHSIRRKRFNYIRGLGEKREHIKKHGYTINKKRRRRLGPNGGGGSNVF